MKEHIDLIMGLVVGLALTFLNNKKSRDVFVIHTSLDLVRIILTIRFIFLLF